MPPELLWLFVGLALGFGVGVALGAALTEDDSADALDTKALPVNHQNVLNIADQHSRRYGFIPSKCISVVLFTITGMTPKVTIRKTRPTKSRKRPSMPESILPQSDAVFSTLYAKMPTLLQ